MKFRLLGPVEVLAADGSVNLSSKQRHVLAALLIDAGQVVTLHELAVRVWERPPPAADSTLYAHISRLRRMLTAEEGASLTRTNGGYAIQVPRDCVDVLQFRQLVEQTQNPGLEDERLAALLRQALDLWRGTPLAGMPSIWAAGVRESLEQQRITVATLWARAQLQLGRPQSVVTELGSLLAWRPLVEPLVAELMQALHACGRTAEALDWFARTREHLIEELGTEPGPALSELHVAMLRGHLDVAPGPRSSTIRRPSAVPAQLPAYASDFTGRSGYLRQLDELLSEIGARTIVICGTAGVGKTTLAVHWARLIRDRFPDGQLHVNMHGFSSQEPMKPVEALTQFLRAFGVPPGEIPVDADEAAALYRSLLADKKVLILLDNVASADQVRPLLPGAADCLVLITSRSRLSRLVARDGARRISLDVLPIDEAVALLDRLLGSSRAAGESAIRELAEACACLPLALRISAASIADRPHQRLTDFLHALADGDRLDALAVTDDQRAAVHTAFDVSYDALPGEAKGLFCMIGAFPGPDFAVEAIATLADIEVAQAGQILDQLAAMYMIEQVSDRRYTLHDLLRLYAAKRCQMHITEAERLAGLRRLCRYYLAMAASGARQVSPQLFRLEVASILGPDQSSFAHPRAALEWLDDERQNLVAVTHVAERERLHPLAWLIADALRGYLILRQNKPDWFAIAESGLAAAVDAGDAAGQAAAHHNLAQAYRSVNRLEQAFDHLSLARALSKEGGWAEGHTAALCNLGIMYAHQGKMQEAVAHYTQALDANRKAGSPAGTAVNLGNLAEAYRHMNELPKAIALTTEALSLYTQIGSLTGRAIALANLGGMYQEQHNIKLALEHVEQALAINREVGDRYREAEALSELSRVHCVAGRADEAVSAAKAALEINEAQGDRSLEADARNALAAALAAMGRSEDAIKHYKRARALSSAAGALYYETVASIGLACLLATTGDTAQAATLVEGALKNARRAGYRGLEKRALAVLGSWAVPMPSPAPCLLVGVLAETEPPRT